MGKAGSKDNASPAQPSSLQIALFSFPSLPHAFIALPLSIVIPQFYAANTSVTLLQIATMTTASRVLDAVLDPAIGYLSDRTKTPLGRRKPWLIAASIVCSIAIFFLFQPPKDADFIYYGVWSFLLYSGFTLFEIPRAAWSAELSRDYTQRSRINTYVAAANVIGGFVFWVMPLALFQFTGTTAITGAAIAGIAWLYVALMPAGVLLAAWLVPTGAQVSERVTTIRELFTTFRTNKPLWFFYSAFATWGLGQGVFLGVVFIFLSDYMRIGELFPFLMIAYFGVQMLFLPLWQGIIARFGKHRVWAASMVIDVATRPLILLVAPGDAVLIFATIGLIAVLSAPANICPYAILADVVDYDILKSRVNKAGNIFAFNALLVKVTMAFGTGLAFVMLDLVQYRVGQADNAATANAGLIACYLLFPAIFYGIGSAIIWFFPIDARRHGIIRRRIERRAGQQA